LIDTNNSKSDNRTTATTAELKVLLENLENRK